MSEKRVALVIGNGDYKKAGLLLNPPNDAKAIAKALSDLDFEVVSGVDLGIKEMQDEIASFEERLVKRVDGGVLRADAALLFFAGHGLQVEDENYLLPVDADIQLKSHLQWRAVPLNKVLSVMAARAKASLIFLDACRNNPFKESLERALAEMEGRARALNAGLAKIEIVPNGSFIAFATAPGRTAEDGRGKNSPFTEGLVAHMGTPGQSLSDLMIKVRNKVVADTNNKQRPWEQSDLDAPFYFKRAEERPSTIPPDMETPQPPPPPASPEHEYWADTKAKLDPNAFERFLLRFPEGDFAGLAADRCMERITACSDPDQLERLLKDYPRSSRTGAAKARMATLLWRSLERSKDRAALDAFILRFSKSSEAEKARSRLIKFEDRSGFWPKNRIAGGAVAVAVVGLLIWRPWSGSEITPISDAQTQATKLVERPKEEPAKSEKLKPETVPTMASKLTRLDAARANEPLSAAELAVLKPKDEFQECEHCPRMLVVPAGKFTMGSPSDELERFGDEGPQHQVTISKPFAVGKYAVTFEEWDACVADGGCGGYKPSDSGWGRGNRPVINVSWEDAQAYAQWLSKKIGKTYRLLSEAESEYVTRAGTTTPFWWGSTITPDQANYDGTSVYQGGGSKGEYRQKTVPVNSFKPNPWGLYQVHGNVWEWVQDCYADSYKGAPNDGSPAIETSGCSRVLRGGSWSDDPWFLRAAYRFGVVPTVRYSLTGFRLSRTL